MLRREFLGRVGSSIAGALLANAGFDYLRKQETIEVISELILTVGLERRTFPFLGKDWYIDPKMPVDRIYHLSARDWSYGPILTYEN